MELQQDTILKHAQNINREHHVLSVALLGLVIEKDVVNLHSQNIMIVLPAQSAEARQATIRASVQREKRNRSLLHGCC